MLVFFGAGAIVIDAVSEGSIGHLGIAIAFGTVVTVMIYAFIHVSGAHINPAVTLAFTLTGRFEKRQVLPYILAQVLAAIAASYVLLLLVGNHKSLGSTLPIGSWHQSFILEVIMTYILMLVILMVSQRKDYARYTAPAVGLIVMLLALVGGPISGASMNPARSLGPALVSGDLADLWIYLISPVLGAILATFTWLYFREEGE